MYKYLEIVSHEDGEVVKRSDVTNKTERTIDKIDSGMNRNLNHAEYFTRETESEEELKTI